MFSKVISSHRLIKEGFLQAFYIHGQYEVLLSTIQKGTGLDLHDHTHIQFGYCFSGSFKFKAGEEWAEIGAGSSYILASGIPHCADATETFYALDYKYNGPITEVDHRIFRMGVFGGEYNVNGVIVSHTTVGNAKIVRLVGKGEIPLVPCLDNLKDIGRIYLAPFGEIGIVKGNYRENLYPMNVYEITEKEQLFIDLASGNSTGILLGIR